MPSASRTGLVRSSVNTPRQAAATAFQVARRRDGLVAGNPAGSGLWRQTSSEAPGLPLNTLHVGTAAADASAARKIVARSPTNVSQA